MHVTLMRRLERSTRRSRGRRVRWEMRSDCGGEQGQRPLLKDPLLGAEQRAEMRIRENLPTPAALRAVAGNYVHVRARVGVPLHQT